MYTIKRYIPVVMGHAKIKDELMAENFAAFLDLID